MDDKLLALLEIIREEYGIDTPEQLLDAVKTLTVDVTPLCASPNSARR